MPAALVLWFMWKARGNGLFLLGIPVLMVMRGSVFFEKMKPFWTPGRFDPVTLIMIWLVLVWIVTILRRSRLDGSPVAVFGSGGILPEELPLVGIGILVVVHTIGAFAVSGDLANAVSLASETSYLLLGYLLLRGIFCRATRAETQEFLAAVVIVNTLACALFFLDQGLHLSIYQGAANITYLYAGQDIARATTFAPVFDLLALGFVLAKRRWTPGWMVVLAITLLAILVSLTRTLLIAAAVGFVIAIVARELTKPDFGRVMRRIGATVLGAAVVAFGFSRIAPAYWGVLLKRLDEFTSGSVAQAQELAGPSRPLGCRGTRRGQERFALRSRFPASGLESGRLTRLPLVLGHDVVAYHVQVRLCGPGIVRTASGGVHGALVVELPQAARAAARTFACVLHRPRADRHHGVPGVDVHESRCLSPGTSDLRAHRGRGASPG